MLHIPEKELKDTLVSSGFISEKEFDSVIEEAKRTAQDIESLLIEQGLISEEYFTKILADYFKVPFFDFSGFEMTPELLSLVPENIAKTHKVIAVGASKKDITLAMEDPGDLKTIQFMERKIGKKINPVLVTHKNLKEALSGYKKSITQEFDKIINENVDKAMSTGVNDAEKMAQDIPVTKILDTLIEYAAAQESSDIHIEPLDDEVLVRFRIDGILQDVINLPYIVHSALAARVKLISDLKIDEHRLPQDGRFRYKLDETSMAIRVSVIPTIYGEKIVLRLLMESARPMNLESLGLEQQDMAVIRDAIKKTHGMVLSTGPTGSGKTTSLYTILHLINKPEVNISTIEDPVEYDIRRVNQIQVNVKTGLTFADGLRSLLRQDPDIIMVGEIRDSDTAELAVHAALTGHLVLSTLHTNNAAGAIPRLVDIGVQPFLLASTVNLIIAQRLVRRVCPGCITPKPITKEEASRIFYQLGISGKDIKKYKLPKTVFAGKGCKECHNSGYRGMVGIFEILRVNNEIRELVLQKAPESRIEAQAIKDGMRRMLEDGLEKAESGITTYEEIMRVIRD
ncbi:hypothetical protein COX95_03370 [bacterium CG_4_10_14_0_2_um_filter_33_32]|nr:MAG: hypothetical protein COU50_02860 [bacterium CG10_big_fil_rev_8_21_14_0_10_33_18]PIU77052.1 MAG: hypothetical protein COS74_00825 [bacterium CG06_land_8_20_14_3_00_33_50]PIW81399.1 MAG: hypothetical protein COZ97_02045 [bacterium CG_4_8_14_3_um_filter_33_28]PIY85332.1 MAG: hypothetical protein COY76_02690 [bacterium CG_4_10_14_0_8_um_filter_33_57]PIZ85605.1 MAG: hypothetical protein COX95_03370 [bacterium CG_4_10_14_0_2_um_filter_33_32]PJA71913.1 MAG: hypothetical protein CO152_04150 [b